MASKTKKIPLTPEQAADAARLKALFLSRKSALGLTQEVVADRLGISQGGVSHYLNGVNALNLRVATIFADLLQVGISEFSPSLERERLELAGLSNDSGERSELLARLAELVTDFSPSEMAELRAQADLIQRRKRGDL